MNEPVYTHEVMIDPRTIDEHEQRIVWAGKALEIMAVLAPAGGSGAPHHYTVQCREVRIHE